MKRRTSQFRIGCPAGPSFIKRVGFAGLGHITAVSPNRTVGKSSDVDCKGRNRPCHIYPV